MKKHLLFFKTQLLAAALAAQADSLPPMLPPAVLSDSHVVKFKPQPQPWQFISATHFAETMDDLPFTMHVVSGEEILRNGYVTLADVLKSAPGIRVSQPGNAMEGELFMMRGLLGNEYVKVLVNDVPVKPSLAVGMPIGAQLPIRQAERVEILYGPASAAYGSDACVGVVNIILKESERPVFTQADLAFGRNGYNSLDLMFGGKIGKGRNIFRFTAWGSTTVRETQDVFTDANTQKLLQPNQYLTFGHADYLYNTNLNYLRNSGGDSIPRKGPLPHDSRVFGLNFKWRGINFTYNRMRRFEHTSLGINPLATTYSNASNRITERIETFSAGFKARIGRLNTQNTLSAILYNIDPTSTHTPVFDAPFAAFAGSTIPPGIPQVTVDSIIGQFYYYNFDSRIIYARSIDFRHELKTKFNFGGGWTLDAGWQANLGGGIGLTRYGIVPPKPEVFTDSFGPDGVPFDPGSDGDLELTPFASLNVHKKRLTLMAGLSGNLSLIYLNETVLSPRVAGLVKINKKWAVFGNWTTGVRRPNFSYYSNSFGYRPGQEVDLISLSSKYFEVSEKVSSIEAGVRYRAGNSRLDVSVFQQQVFDQIRNGYFLKDKADLEEPYYYGYANSSGLSHEIWGVQASAISNTLDFSGDWGERKFVMAWKNELHFQFAQGAEHFGQGYPNSNAIRNQPRWMWQFRSSWRSGRFAFVLAWNRQSSWKSGSVFYREKFSRRVADDMIPGFKTWDLMLRQNLSKHLLVYFQLQNIFNKRYAGIDATGTADDLLFNPQFGRQWRLGINYNMN